MIKIVKNCKNCDFRHLSGNANCEAEDTHYCGIDTLHRKVAKRGKPEWCAINKSPIVFVAHNKTMLGAVDYASDSFSELLKNIEKK